MTESSYSDYGTEWTKAIIADLDGEAFEIGIESDRKRRGSAVNVEVMDYDEARNLFVLCVRKSEFHPRRYTRTRKDYFLCGRNENGNAFAHPVQMNAVNARVEVALCRIWRTTPSVLPKIIRHGDVALIPVRGKMALPEEEAVHTFALNSHIIHAEHLYVVGCEAYVTGHIELQHEKNQHASVNVMLACPHRVQLGVRARTWGFARPTSD
jgi:hypothetical protein